MPQGILLQHDFINGKLKGMERAVQTISYRQLFEVQPEALNGVEVGTVFGQPDHEQSVFVQAQRSAHGLAVVVGGIIHHHNQMLARIFSQQMLKESNKGIAVFVRRGQITDPSAVPIVTSKNMEKLRAAGSRDELAFATTHPAATQRWMQTYCRFIHKEEFGVGDGVKRDVFFNHCVICAIVS